MMGLVWQWTNEFTDERTRAGLIRGGAYYRPTVNAHGGSSWYFPGNIEPDGGVRAGNHNKLLLMAPAYDRHGTVGFRCVADA
jgi:formylglycine-generating enzyme required for sulfatase activity